MYESPINEILGELQFTYDNECMKAVQSVGFDINKEELTKALLYDRNQYEKGFNDGYEKALDDIISSFESWADAINKVRLGPAFFTIENIRDRIEHLK